MKIVDFAVKLTDNEYELSKQIMLHLTVNRAAYNKPTIILMTGLSGEGKSWQAITWARFILEHYGLDIEKHLEDIIIFRPRELLTKFKKLLYDNELKKLNVIIIDEAREVIEAGKWQTYVNKAINDLNALSRGIKPMIIIVCTQAIRDVDRRFRLNVNYYCKCQRPLSRAMPVRMYVTRIWLDDKDLDRIKLKHRGLRGIILKENHKKDLFFPKSFLFSKPDEKQKRIFETYEKLQREAKHSLILSKLEEALEKIDANNVSKKERIEKIADTLLQNKELQETVTETRRKKICLKKDVRQQFGLTPTEFAKLEKVFLKKLFEQVEKQSEVIESGGVAVEKQELV